MFLNLVCCRAILALIQPKALTLKHVGMLLQVVKGGQIENYD